tara:strand:+ start:99 stop:1136 length:1038 start_codon:yes stop_codon:yes gene_type:complete
MKVNLISDTFTVPSKAMISAMMKAEVGDDVFKEDPTLNDLEKRVAELFGMEAGLFFPSGTMSNQVAIKIHTQPGDQLICDKYSHIFHYEGGGVSFNSGVSCNLVDGERGILNKRQIEQSINPADFYHSPPTTLVSLENTSNKGGGTCYNLTTLKSISELCKENDISIHLDGARIWNALVATNTNAIDYGKLFDTISVCFSKGLGCPIGSMLLGNNSIIKKAIRYRKALGGGMRQVGYIAAAANYALDNHVKDLAKDHEKAFQLGELLSKLPYVDEIQPIETNIVIFSLTSNYDENVFIETLAKKNIRLIQLGKGKIRMVTHRNYTDEDHLFTMETLNNLNLNPKP